MCSSFLTSHSYYVQGSWILFEQLSSHLYTSQGTLRCVLPWRCASFNSQEERQSLNVHLGFSPGSLTHLGSISFLYWQGPQNPTCLTLILHFLCCILTLGFSLAVWSSPGCSKLIFWAAGTHGSVHLWHIHIFCVSYQFATWDVEESSHGRG